MTPDQIDAILADQSNFVRREGYDGADLKDFCCPVYGCHSGFTWRLEEDPVMWEMAKRKIVEHLSTHDATRS
ncbi:hypothetical protein [Rhodococcoides fascians]|uniref:hypothetical protein n=1 Tax=Rhodococcoides fascians TaxID=1828 RepID=UPI000ABF7A37|nr:hypothetical protein [Rhodococcus fascians]